jgi:hypothetical protein
MSPKANVLKAWALSWHYGEVVQTLRGGAYQEVSKSLGHTLEGDNGIPDPFCLSVCYPGHGVFLHHAVPS